MNFSLQMLAFVDDLGYTVEIGTEVGFTEEAAQNVPIVDLRNQSFKVVHFLPNGTDVVMVAIRYEEDDSDRGYKPVLIMPMVTVTVDKSQIGAI